MTDNLPAVVKRVGGALELIVSNLEAYTQPEYPLTRRGQIALGLIVEEHPGLNTEDRLALLVDILTYHGIYQRTEFMAIDEDHGIEIVYLALDYLYETGDRGRGKDEDSQAANDMRRVRRTAELIVRLQEAGFNVGSVEQLDDLAHAFGGLDQAFAASEDNVESVMAVDQETEATDGTEDNE